MSPSADQVLEGIAALKAGDRNRARSYFRAAILRDPRNEQAWFGLANVVADQKERYYCLNRVIALNPNNSEAQQALAALNSDSSAPTMAHISERSAAAASAPTMTHISEPKPPVRSSEMSERDLFATARVDLLPPVDRAVASDAQPQLSTFHAFTMPAHQAAPPRTDLRGLTLETQQNIDRQIYRQRTVQLALFCISLFSLLLAIAVAFVI